ncbi:MULTISPECIES: hypothetical protein [Rhodococcus]|uniref:hypothetical protein n=1 Tax=Rhodococcus TaxID=1827 RepID=UPI0029544A56|nr:hypothetical protein [Rhodococcus pyridinivorans]MDV7255707.1 hypothetical protein [Rhodococcus pyridinivorans]
MAIVAAAFALGQVSEARKTRDEQAQPNVVVFAQTNETHWQVLELVVRNYGSTPAYDVEMSFEPDLAVTPYTDQSTGQRVELLKFPRTIPFLAPGQEWRTVWDSAWRRAEHKRATGEVVQSQSEASVTFRDSRGRKFATRSILDWDAMDHATRITVKSIHHVATNLDKQLKELNRSAKKLSRTIDGFRSEREGLWVYAGNPAEQREYRAKEREGTDALMEWLDALSTTRDQASGANAPFSDAAGHNTPSTSPDD